MSKREQILNATLELVSSIGFHETSIPLIIKKSGAAAGTIYHYFKNKDELIDTLHIELKKEMGSAVISGLDQEISFKEKFFLMLANLYNFYISNPQKFEFLESYSHSPLVKNEIKAITQTYYQPAIDFLSYGVKMGILRNLPLNLLISIVFGNISTLTRMIILEEIDTSDQLLEKTIQSSWDSIKIN